MWTIFAVAVAVLAVANAEVYFSYDFSSAEDIASTPFVVSTHKGDEAGEWSVSATQYGPFKGLKTTEDARFYQISAPLDKAFSNEGKTLVLQYSVTNEQSIDCGGAYVKILPSPLDQSDFNGDSPYNVMFGPDICGVSKRTHFIVNNDGENYLIDEDIKTESDPLTHIYTLVLKADQTFSVLIDGDEVRAGSLVDDFSILEPATIPDPDASKPDDWVDVAMIDDPEDSKPSNWDDEPEFHKDPKASKPDDWDDELDGEWEPPVVPNPEFKGEWSPKRIANPAYVGQWEHPRVPNPEYVLLEDMYAFDSNAYIGIEVWQVKSGTVFSHFLVTDDEAVAAEHRDAIASAQAEQKEEKGVADDEARAKLAAEAEEAAAKAAAEADAAIEAGDEADGDLYHDEL